jgi:hypothetical protein
MRCAWHWASVASTERQYAAARASSCAARPTPRASSPPRHHSITRCTSASSSQAPRKATTESVPRRRRRTAASRPMLSRCCAWRAGGAPARRLAIDFAANSAPVARSRATRTAPKPPRPSAAPSSKREEKPRGKPQSSAASGGCGAASQTSTRIAAASGEWRAAVAGPARAARRGARRASAGRAWGPGASAGAGARGRRPRNFGFAQSLPCRGESSERREVGRAVDTNQSRGRDLPTNRRAPERAPDIARGHAAQDRICTGVACRSLNTSKPAGRAGRCPKSRGVRARIVRSRAAPSPLAAARRRCRRRRRLPPRWRSRRPRASSCPPSSSGASAARRRTSVAPSRAGSKPSRWRRSRGSRAPLPSSSTSRPGALGERFGASRCADLLPLNARPNKRAQLRAQTRPKTHPTPPAHTQLPPVQVHRRRGVAP